MPAASRDAAPVVDVTQRDNVLARNRSHITFSHSAGADGGDVQALVRLVAECGAAIADQQAGASGDRALEKPAPGR